MFLTVHAVAGELIAQSAVTPGQALVMGFLSHFLLDALPHGDEDIGDHVHPKRNTLLLFKIAFLDLSIAGIVQASLFATSTLGWGILPIAAAFGAMLPDAMQLPSIILKSDSGLFGWYRRAHESVHNLIGVRLGWKVGLVFQGFTLLLLIDALG
ncbi:hypothetical protein HZA86_05240 [Candidatus Uhrbacteria bacterium]|nr:hypothetical protein [Candidatus Uhrbacteria bacterium]